MPDPLLADLKLEMAVVADCLVPAAKCLILCLQICNQKRNLTACFVTSKGKMLVGLLAGLDKGTQEKLISRVFLFTV
jgi:hypothetical protein